MDSKRFLLLTIGLLGVCCVVILTTSALVSPEFLADVSSATTINLIDNNTLHGELTATGQHKYYRVSLSSSDIYVFQVTSVKALNDSIKDANLAVRSNNGATLAFKDDGNGLEAIFGSDFFPDRFVDPTILFKPSSTGQYILDVGSFRDEEIGNVSSSISSCID